MSMFKGAVKTGIALKILDMVRREAAKPQNQAKAREMFERLTSRTSTSRAGGRAPRSRFAGTRQGSVGRSKARSSRRG
jgi:hypothetical protein